MEMSLNYSILASVFKNFLATSESFHLDFMSQLSSYYELL